MTAPPAATFGRHERINDPAAFRRAFGRKRSASDAHLMVYGVENGLDHARLGISVGKKRVRRAHDRNRVKRLLREAFRLSKSELPVGVDLVVVPRGAALTFAAARAGLPALAQAVARRLGPRPAKALPCSARAPAWPSRAAVALLVGLIRVYQATLSPLFGPACRFDPSCSRYMVGALRKYGLVRGIAKGVGRVLRCHPWNPGGYDPP